jgi:pimeloyl-ACP methyl ester carboxylesterase
MEDLSRRDETGRQEIEAWVEISYAAPRCFKAKPMVNPTLLSDAEWQGIQVPTLFLVGENEKIYSAREAVERLQKVAPRIKTDIIPRAGHDLTIVQAGIVNRKVLEFLGP